MKTISFLTSYFLSITPHTFKFDAPERWQLLFQDAATKIMNNIIDLHHDIMFFLVVTCTFVFYMLMRIVLAFRIENTDTIRTSNNTYYHHYNIYCFIRRYYYYIVILLYVPSLISMFIALHSSTIVYALDSSDQASWSNEHDIPRGDYYNHYRRKAHDAFLNAPPVAKTPKTPDPIMTIYKYHNDHGSGVMVFDHVNKTWTIHPDVVPDNQPSEPKKDTKPNSFIEDAVLVYLLSIWTAGFLSAVINYFF